MTRTYSRKAEREALGLVLDQRRATLALTPEGARRHKIERRCLFIPGYIIAIVSVLTLMVCVPFSTTILTIAAPGIALLSFIAGLMIGLPVLGIFKVVWVLRDTHESTVRREATLRRIAVDNETEEIIAREATRHANEVAALTRRQADARERQAAESKARLRTDLLAGSGLGPVNQSIWNQA